ncbi:Calponin-homology (CH) domain-containing protein [Entamoeba marina]
MSDKQPHWVRTQKKTFTKWANVQLNGSYVINDVEKDLDDGLILISLFECLRKQKVQFKYNKKPKMRIAKVENTSQALEFIKADGVKLVNIDSQNIVDGHLTLILGLLWTLILKYQIAQNKMDASKNALLEWVNSKLKSHQIKNFGNDWSNGEVLCDLIDALEPDFIDLGAANNKTPGEDRIAYGESIAEEKMDIPAIIEPADMAMKDPDELSVMAYVSYFRHYESEKLKKLGEAERLAAEELLMKTPDPLKCTMSGPGLKTGEVFIPQEFTVQAKNVKGDNIPCGGHTWQTKVTDPNGEDVPIETVDNGDGTYDMKYIPQVPGKHSVEVAYEGKQLKQSPAIVLITPAQADPSNCYADGEGVTECTAGQGKVSFTIHAVNKIGKEVPVAGLKFKVVVRDPQDEVIASEVVDNNDGTYTGSYEPIPGIDEVHIVLLNQSIKDAPYHCKVFQDPKTASIANSYAYGPGVEGGIGIEKTPVFRIQGVRPDGEKCEQGGDEFKVEVKGPDGKVQNPDVVDRNNGTYDVKYKALVPGVYDVSVKLQNPEKKGEFCDIKNSVYHPEILDGVCASKTTVTGQGIEEPNDQDDNVFTITAMDSKGQEVGKGGAPFQVVIDILEEGQTKKKDEGEEDDDEDDDDLFKVLDGVEEPKAEGNQVPQNTVGDIPVEVIDNENGTYDCHYKCDAGRIRVKVSLNREKVANSPYILEVEEDADPDNSGIENFCFVVEAKNRRGQVQKDGKAKFVVELDGPEGKLEDQKVKTKHLGEGKYFISYSLPAVTGEYHINCKLNRRHIANSPFKQTVN